RFPHKRCWRIGCRRADSHPSRLVCDKPREQWRNQSRESKSDSSRRFEWLRPGALTATRATHRAPTRPTLPRRGTMSGDAFSVSPEALRFCLQHALRYHPEDLLKRPKSIEELRTDARQGFELATYKLRALNLARVESLEDLHTEIGDCCAALNDALTFFMAIGKRHGIEGSALPLHLLPL